MVIREGFQNELQDVAFVGVSQGVVIELALSPRDGEKSARVSFAGLMPLPRTSSSSDTSISLIHGEADGTIPSSSSVAASGELRSAGYKRNAEIFPNVGHTMSSEQAKEAVAFLKRLA